MINLISLSISAIFYKAVLNIIGTRFIMAPCKNVLLVQPSSAAAERVFSILSSSFTERQTSSLEDYIETSVMLQYNNSH